MLRLLDLSISSLALRQHEEEVIISAFALSTDDGENLTDDDDAIMESYENGNAT